MEKRIKYKASLALLLVFGLLILSACGSGLEKQLREKAESYAAELASKAGVQDKISITSNKADVSSKSDPVAFLALSESHNANFSVWVSRDGSVVTDDYYRLSLQKTAREGIQALLGPLLAEASFDVDAVLTPVSLPALSAGRVSSLRELMQAEGNLAPLRIQIHAKDGKTQMTQAQTDTLLLALVEAGLSATLYPYESDAVYYEILKDGIIWETRRSGADGGAMLIRGEYIPTAEK